MSKDFLISVICTTYNRPDALYAVLNGLSHQKDSNFEVVIADDGSRDETRELIRAFSRSSPFKLTHAWQEDKGFRAAAARNLALKYCQGEYVLLLDGDCIPFPGWISNHRVLSENGWTVPGQRILTSESFCKELLNNQRLLENFDWSVPYLRELSREGKINRYSPILSLGARSCSFWRKLKPANWKKARSCNWGVWKKDLDAVNGFNESIVGWGHEDSDLAIRLMNQGVRFKSGSFATAVLHLWHREESRNKAQQNWETATANLDDSAG